MRSEANNNPNLSEEKLDSICNRLTMVLDGISVFQRRFFPPEFPELRKELILHQTSLTQVKQELGEAARSPELSGPWETITEACDLMLDAIELILGASASDFQDIVTRAMRSFRRFCRIQEKLYPIRIFWVHGALDWMFPVQSARTAVEMLESAGANVTLRVIDDLSHTYPREENNQILQWFEPGLALPA